MSAFASLLALSIGLVACSSDSDDTPPPVSNDAVVDLTLDSASTVPPATGADAASGTGSFTINRDTGAVSGSVTVSGTTGPVVR